MWAGRAVPTGMLSRPDEPDVSLGGCRHRESALAPSMSSDLEAFSHKTADVSFAPLAFQPSALPIIRPGGSSRTEPDYYGESGPTVG